MRKSNGISNRGLLLLNQSIEAYLYCILGAQSRTRRPIVSTAASSLETQAVFRQIVEDTIINYDVTTTISNMRLAVKSCNVILNTAISNSLWLIPDSMIILKHSIPGYNNTLFTADQNKMSFGINRHINKQQQKESSPVKTIIQNIPTDKPIKNITDKRKIFTTNLSSDGNTEQQNIGKETVFAVTVLLTFILSRYIL